MYRLKLIELVKIFEYKKNWPGIYLQKYFLRMTPIIKSIILYFWQFG